MCRFVISNVIYGKNVIYADTGSTLGATSPMRGNAIYVYGNPCGHPSRRPRYARALRMRAEIAEVHQTRALILRSMRAQHACVSKDGRTSSMRFVACIPDGAQRNPGRDFGQISPHAFLGQSSSDFGSGRASARCSYSGLQGRHLCADTSSMGSGHFRLFAGDVKRTSPMSSMRATSPMLTAGENY